MSAGAGWLPENRGLSVSTRLPRPAVLTGSPALADWLILISAGVSAALASGLLDFNLRIPGHAILRVVFPMAAGLALVPRRGAGCVMSGSALMTALGLRLVLPAEPGGGLSLGSLTSLTLTGPLLDAALHHSRGGWRMYLAFALAGLVSNEVAFKVQTLVKSSGLGRGGGGGGGGGRMLAEWLSVAGWTYPVCGLLAGLLSAMIWFAARPAPDRPAGTPRPAGPPGIPGTPGPDHEPGATSP